jgi:hypothetical protein
MNETQDSVLLLQRIEELRVHLQELVKQTRGGTTTNASSGLMLREASIETGNGECPHAELRQECSFNGVKTSAYVCSMCGELMLVSACHRGDTEIKSVSAAIRP